MRFASGGVDASDCSLDQTVARVNDDGLADAYSRDLRFSDSQNSLQRSRIGNARNIGSGRYLLAFGHQYLLENATASCSDLQPVNFLPSKGGKRT